MRARRIIMSDDEDDGAQDGGENYFLSTPASSSDLVRHLTELNMKSGTKIGANTSEHRDKSSMDTLQGQGSYGNGIQLSQSDDGDTLLDPESTVKIMQGAVAGRDEEEDEYDFTSDPFAWRAGSAPSPKAASRTASAMKRGTKKPDKTTASGRPKREAATRAQAQLQSMYSEYGMNGSSHQQSGDDESFAENGNGSTESSRDASAAETDSGDDQGEVGDDSNSDAKSSTRRQHAASASKHSAERKRATSNSNSGGDRARASAERDEASRRQSARSSRLSSRKEQQYQKARNDMQQKAAGGLETVLLSSSGSDGDYEGVDEVEEETAAHTVSQRSSHSSSARKAMYAEDTSPVRERDRDLERGRGQGSSGRKFEPRTQYSYSVSKIKSPKSASKCVGLLHRRDEREEDDGDESGESDINDFIVNSDEERAEEEARAAEAAERRELRRQQKRSEKQRKNSAMGGRAKDIIAAATLQLQREQSAGSSRSAKRTAPSDSDEAEIVPVRRTQASATKEPPSSDTHTMDGAGGGSVGRKRRLIVDSEDEGYAPDTTETPANKRRSVGGGGQASGAVDLTVDDMDVTGGVSDGPVTGAARGASSGGSSKAAARGKARKDSPDAGSTEGSDGDSGEESQNEVGEGEEEDSDAGSEAGTEESEEEQSDDSASDLDGPALYYKVNSMMDRREGRDEELNTITGMRKRFPVAEAMQFYIELLAHALVDPDFLGNCHSNPKLNAATGNHPGPMGSGRKSKAERDAVEQASNYVSASRQIENLLCTSRESLIGSGAWNKEFYAELQARPFYNCSRTILCGSSGGGGRGGDDGEDDSQGDGDEEKNVKCAACNRSTQPPDMQVFLFGSRYNARSVWNSTRWDQHIPPELFLYPQEQEEEGYMHESSSNLNNRGRSSSSAWESPRAPAAALRRNKQFQGYQTIMSGGIKRYGDAYSVQAGTGASSSVAAQAAGAGGSSTGKGRLRPDEALVESWQASARKRKMIVLSDDSEGEEEEGGEGDRGRGKRAKSMSREEEEEAAEAAAAAEAEAIVEANERSEEDRVRSWWKQKFPREFTREKESIYFLSFHCKNRTRLYHTLLHYKFRLLMNIRARLLRAANVLAGRGMIDAVDDDDSGYRRSSQGGMGSGGRGRGSSQSAGRGESQFDTSWEQWDADDKQRLLSAAVEELKGDAVFVDQEARRFQTLISETERRYGGREEPRHDIWGDEDESASATSHAKPSQQTQTIRKWLSKQKEKPSH